jgi:hypothetical protein
MLAMDADAAAVVDPSGAPTTMLTLAAIRAAAATPGPEGYARSTGASAA